VNAPTVVYLVVVDRSDDNGSDVKPLRAHTTKADAELYALLHKRAHPNVGGSYSVETLELHTSLKVTVE
jgi:hypothetical protein